MPRSRELQGAQRRTNGMKWCSRQVIAQRYPATGVARGFAGFEVASYLPCFPPHRPPRSALAGPSTHRPAQVIRQLRDNAARVAV